MDEGKAGASRSSGQSAAVAVGSEAVRGSPGKAGSGRDLTEGSIPKNLWSLTWPQMVEGVLNLADQLADLVWAGHLGARSLAGLGVAQVYANLPLMGRSGFDIAMRAMIARAVGARDIALANHVALQAFTLSGLFSVATVLVGIFFTEPLMRALGVSDEVVAAGADYMRVLFAGQAVISFRMMSGAALQASGDVVTPMKATTVTRVVHVALSPFLVFGLWFFPEMGLMGAAVANVLAELVGMGMNFRALFSGRSRLRLTFKGYRVDLPLLWQIVKVGTPGGLTGVVRTIALVVLMGVVARFGDYAVAAYSLTRRPELISSVGLTGLSQAAGILVGQNLGAGKGQRARATAGWAVGLATLIQFIIGVLAFAFAREIISLFNQQPELLEIATVWLRIQALAFTFWGPHAILQQTFNLAGDTRFPMIQIVLTYFLVEIPLSFLLPNLWNLGQFGIAWATNASAAAFALVGGCYFLWGPWMERNPFGRRKTVGVAN